MNLQVSEPSPGSDDQDQTTAVVEAPAATNEGDQVTDANSASSSDADARDANEPKSLLDVVKTVVEQPKEPEASSTPEGDQEKPEAGEPEAKAEEQPAEDDANLPFHNHPRWKEVLAERDSLKHPAEQYSKITGFMQEHGLAPDEVAEGFEVMAALKSNDHAKLAEVRDWFAARLQSLDQVLGNALPDDLRERVENGLLDEEGAQEIARARASTSLRETRDVEQQRRDQEAREAERIRATATELATAVEGWETRIKASDPDYPKKAKMIERAAVAIVSRTKQPPANAAEAVALVEQAYAEVNEELKSLVPKPRQITPAPKGSSAVSAPAPKSLREAISAAVAR